MLAPIGNEIDRHAEDISKDQGIRFQLVGGPLPVNTEPARLEMILANLLTNAVDYSPPGTEITLSWTKSSKLVLISVEDQGRGLTPVTLCKYFDPSIRARTKKMVRSKGVDLGFLSSRSVWKLWRDRLRWTVSPERCKIHRLVTFVPSCRRGSFSMKDISCIELLIFALVPSQAKLCGV